MNEIVTAPYGSWKSPITAEFVTSGTMDISSVCLDGGSIYWLESRPHEQGRSTVVRLGPNGAAIDITPMPFNVRSRVHEYGGGAFVAAGGTVYFSNAADDAVYAASADTEPAKIVGKEGARFADFVYDRHRGSLIAVMEQHTDTGTEPVNSLVRISVVDGLITNLGAGADFYSSAALSPDGKTLAWLSWNHPNMPWDGTILNIGNLDSSGNIEAFESVAGGPDESIFQPQWSPDGVLYFVSDRSGWWNLYSLLDGAAQPVWPKDAEFGKPQWVFGQSTYGFLDERTIFCTYTESGLWRSALVDRVMLRVSQIDLPYTMIDGVRAGGGAAWFVGGSPTRESELAMYRPADDILTVIRKTAAVTIDRGYLSVPRSIEFPNTDGDPVYAIFYPPKNDLFDAPEGTLPPLLISCHGGPTSASVLQIDRQVLYWTSRGFAFAYVNYSGSTGYGREYRKRLDSRWGVVDVSDCVDAARYLADQELVDENLMTIHGGSAGGYVALAALTFYDVFTAGASRYGISDLEALAVETHKFESRYMDSLVGPYPEKKALYIERSPIHFTNRLASPIIFFQGSEDKVVPPEQSKRMVEAMKKRNIPVAYIEFDGEGHGFRNAENAARTLKAMLYFYGQVLEIDIVDQIEPVEIDGFN